MEKETKISEIELKIDSDNQLDSLNRIIVTPAIDLNVKNQITFTYNPRFPRRPKAVFVQTYFDHEPKNYNDTFAVTVIESTHSKIVLNVVRVDQPSNPGFKCIFWLDVRF